MPRDRPETEITRMFVSHSREVSSIILYIVEEKRKTHLRETEIS